MESRPTSPIKATIWSFIERLSTEAMTFVIGVILARLLSPTDYGIIGLTTIFIVVSNVFIESGFSNALIRKVDRTEKDLSTAFYFNFVVGIFLYGLLFLFHIRLQSFYRTIIDRFDKNSWIECLVQLFVYCTKCDIDCTAEYQIVNYYQPVVANSIRHYCNISGI